MPPELGGDDQAEDRGSITRERPTYSRDLAQRRPLSEDEKVEQAKKRAAQAERDRLNPGLIAAIQAGEAATGKSQRANKRRREAETAKETFVRLNANLVHSEVKRYRIQGQPQVVEYDDLWQAGAMALLRAAGKWQPGKAKFSSYAVKAIRNAILRELASTDRAVRIPEGMLLGDVAALRKAVEATKHNHPDGWVDYDELAAESTLSVEKVRELIPMLYATDNPLAINGPPSVAEESTRQLLQATAPATPTRTVEGDTFAGPESRYEDDPMHDPDFLNELLASAMLSEEELITVECRFLRRNEWGEPAPLTLAETDNELQRRRGTAKELQESALQKLQAAGPELLHELLAA